MKAGTGHSSPRWGHMVLGASSMELLNLRVARHGWPGGTQILGGFCEFFFWFFQCLIKRIGLVLHSLVALWRRRKFCGSSALLWRWRWCSIVRVGSFDARLSSIGVVERAMWISIHHLYGTVGEFLLLRGEKYSKVLHRLVHPCKCRSSALVVVARLCHEVGSSSRRFNLLAFLCSNVQFV